MVDHFAAAVNRGEGHLQMLGQRRRVEIGAIDAAPADAEQRVRECLGERGFAQIGLTGAVIILLLPDRIQRSLGEVGCRHNGLAQGLWQCADVLRGQLRAQPRHQPVKALRPQVGQKRHGHVHGHTVERIARLELVAQCVIDRALAPHLGEGCGGGINAFVVEERGGVEVQVVLVFGALFLPPGIEVAGGGHALGQA